MDDIAQARELERQASQAQREGRYADADAPLEAAIEMWTRLRGPDDVEVLNCQMNLAVAYRRRAEAARAIPLLERVVALLPHSQDPDVPALLITARNNLATAHRSVGACRSRAAHGSVASSRSTRFTARRRIPNGVACSTI